MNSLDWDCQLYRSRIVLLLAILLFIPQEILGSFDPGGNRRAVGLLTYLTFITVAYPVCVCGLCLTIT